jgi:transposase
VAQVRLAHTQVLDGKLRIPNTAAGFAAFWAHLQRRQRETGVTEIVCALEPTGTYHEALARFLEAQGADVVLVSNTVAHHNRRTLDGTWGKSDPKDAHNLCDLLERGRVLFYSLPDGPVAELRRLVRLLRHARVELGACKARFRNTLSRMIEKGTSGMIEKSSPQVFGVWPSAESVSGAERGYCDIGPPREDRSWGNVEGRPRPRPPALRVLLDRRPFLDP